MKMIPTPQELAAAVCPFLDEQAVVTGLVHHDAKDQVNKINDTVFMDIPDLETDTTLDEIVWTEFLIPQEDLELYPFQDIEQIYLAPSARSLTKGVDMALFELLSKAVTGRAGPCRTGTLRQPDVRACLGIACSHFDTKETPEENRYLILQPETETKVLKAGCFDPSSGRCVGGFQGYLSYMLGLKYMEDAEWGKEYVKDADAPSAYAWHRDAMAIATRRRAPDPGYDEAFLSGSGLGVQVGTRVSPDGSELGPGLLVRLSVLFGLEVLDPSLIAIFQDLP